MLKNTTNSRKVGHDLQRKVLKDAANSGKVDHDLQRKVLKDAGNSKEVDLDLVHLTMMLKNDANSRKVDQDLQRIVLKDTGNSKECKVLLLTFRWSFVCRCFSYFFCNCARGLYYSGYALMSCNFWGML